MKSTFSVEIISRTALFLAVLLTICLPELIAQPPIPAMTPTQAPIDGGLSSLAVACGVYAYKKLRDNKKEA